MSRTRIKVAHIITNFALGGAQDYLFLVVRGMDRTLFEPMILGRMEGEWVPMALEAGDMRVVDIRSLRREISPVNDARAILEIRDVCRREGIQVVHTHSSKAGVVGRLGAFAAGVRGVAHTVHGFSFHDFMPPWQRAVFVGVERAMSRFTSTLVLLCESNAETARRERIGARRSREVIHYGIDFSPFDVPVDREAVRRSLGYTGGEIVVGFTGRFSEQKALHILVEAFSLVRRDVPQLRLLLVGDGRLRRDLEDQARRNGVADSVLVTGFRRDVPLLLRAMDLFMMTSLWEGLSRSLAEAMYVRLPCIATDVGGTPEAVRTGETGWLVPANNVAEAANALRDAALHPDRAAAAADRAHAWARATFDVNTMHEKMKDLYLRLAALNPGLNQQAMP